MQHAYRSPVPIREPSIDDPKYRWISDNTGNVMLFDESFPELSRSVRKIHPTKVKKSSQLSRSAPEETSRYVSQIVGSAKEKSTVTCVCSRVSQNLEDVGVLYQQTLHESDELKSTHKLPKGSYETFRQLLPFNPHLFDTKLRDMTIEDLISEYSSNQSFREFMRNPAKLKYLAERFMLSHETTFEKLLESYEFRKCFERGTLYRHPSNSLYWTVFDGDIELMKHVLRKMYTEGQLPEFQHLCELSIQRHPKNDKMLAILLTHAVRLNAILEFHAFLELAVRYNGEEIFDCIYNAMVSVGRIVDIMKLINIAIEWNQKSMLRKLRNLSP